MKALIYDVASGQILQKIYSASTFIDARQVPAGAWIHYGWVDGPGFKIDSTDPNPNNHTIIPDPNYNPLAAPVSRSDITSRRKELEEMPITVTVSGEDYTIDYDSYSREIIPKTVANWALITETKVDIGGVEHIGWADANNQVKTFTQAEFTTLANELESEAAKRSDRLHAHARTLIQQLPNVTVADIEESQWPMTE